MTRWRLLGAVSLTVVAALLLCITLVLVITDRDGLIPVDLVYLVIVAVVVFETCVFVLLGRRHK